MTHAEHLRREVQSQPDDWAAALTRLPEAAAVLPRPGERVAVIGCGTSWFMGQAYAAARELSGQGVTDAFTASDHRLDRGYDRAVVICRSGTTTEVVDVVEELHRRGLPHVSLVATMGTPVADLSTTTLDLSDFDEHSVVQSRFATTVLTTLRASLGEPLDAVIDATRSVLAEPGETAYGHLLGAEQVTFVGDARTTPIATEAALKLRESAQFWAESYNAMEYRHGPISIAGPGRVVWAFGEVPNALAEQVAATGAHFEHRDIDAQAELVRVHRLCIAMSEARGLDPDTPRNLSRSIILEDA